MPAGKQQNGSLSHAWARDNGESPTPSPQTCFSPCLAHLCKWHQLCSKASSTQVSSSLPPFPSSPTPGPHSGPTPKGMHASPCMPRRSFRVSCISERSGLPQHIVSPLSCLPIGQSSEILQVTPFNTTHSLQLTLNKVQASAPGPEGPAALGPPLPRRWPSDAPSSALIFFELSENLFHCFCFAWCY